MSQAQLASRVRILWEHLKFHLYWVAPALFQSLSLFKLRLSLGRRGRRVGPCDRVLSSVGDAVRHDGYCLRVRDLRVDRSLIDYDANPRWPKLRSGALAVDGKALQEPKRRFHGMPLWSVTARRSIAQGTFDNAQVHRVSTPAIAHLDGFDKHNPALALRMLEQLFQYLHANGMSTDQFLMLDIYAHPDADTLPVAEMHRKFFPEIISAEDVIERRFVDFDDLRVFHAPLNKILLDRSKTSFWRFRRKLFERFGLAEPEPFARARRLLIIERNFYPQYIGEEPRRVRRCMTNASALAAELGAAFPQLNVEIAELDQLSCIEQARRISNSQIVIGVHGAGLAQTPYFLPPGGGMLELFPYHYRKPHAALLLHALCRTSGMRYMRWINRRRRREVPLDAMQPGDFWRDMAEGDAHYATEIPPLAIIAKVRKLLAKVERREP